MKPSPFLLLLPCSFLCFCLLTGCHSPSNIDNSKIRLYPNPPRNSTDSTLAESTTFDLIVNGQDAWVYRNCQPGQNPFNTKEASFSAFKFKGKAQLELRTASPIIKWYLSPAIESARKIDDEKISLEIENPMTFLLEAHLLKGGTCYFVISAEPLE